ncbi:MAG: hypothetical protein LAP40_13225, partial [Acidobacteriia bacterium]|nr:hypothetical protein [Terriglobia bacterium]
SNFRSSFRSLFVTSIRRAGRAIPKVCPKTFLNGIVLLELLQAVRELGRAGVFLRQAEPTLGVECYFADFDGIYRVG